MNRYNLQHRPETEITDQLPAYMEAVDKIASLFAKVEEAMQKSGVLKVVVKYENSDVLPALSPMSDNGVGISVRLKSTQFIDMPVMTMTIPIANVVSADVDRLAEWCKQQINVSLINWTKLEGIRDDEKKLPEQPRSRYTHTHLGPFS